ALQIHLRRLTGVRSENGTVNIAQFRKQLEGKKSSEEAVRKASEREIHIASLSIKVDQIATVDFSEGAEKRSEYSVGFERQFADVSDIFSVGPVLVQACEAVGLSRATDAIFATLLPDFLWGRIGEKGNAYSPA